ncbi:hypothetical protein [Spongiimicrobium sp. 3-5]|uniref:hypothetical protein n=1 Tax=Spongiimicrobium sp. 3-5 TaxID=3332596 RepID=UPI00397EF041
MRNVLCAIFTLAFSLLWAQPNTEVYLLHLKADDTGISLSDLVNISNNHGYDNQPSFIGDSLVLYTSTRDNQTDVVLYRIKDQDKTWIAATEQGSEYSPLKIPEQEAVSAIRLDKDGTQLLYRYDLKSGAPNVLLNDLKVGYHVWYNTHMLISSVLVEDRMDLVVSNLKDNSNHVVQKNVGRSLHRIPNSDLVSFIGKEQDEWEIKSLNPITGATDKITHMIPKSQDICWLANGTILIGSGNRLLKFDPKTDSDWIVVQTFSQKGIKNITRLSVNSANTLLALVAE